MKRIFLLCGFVLILLCAGCSTGDLLLFESEPVFSPDTFDADTTIQEDDAEEAPVHSEGIECEAPDAVFVSPEPEPPEKNEEEYNETTVDTVMPEDRVITDTALEAIILEEISLYEGSWSVYFKRLDTSAVVSISEGPKVAASLVKLFVAGAYFEAVENQELSDDYRADVSVMISDSSNDACNRIIDALGNGDTAAGMKAVTDFAVSVGCLDTKLNRKMLEVSELENYTSPKDCGVLLEAALSGDFVNEESSELLIELLKKQSRTWKIPAGVPSEIETGNKTGELADVENDVAIVWSPACTYILCIMVEDVLSPGITQNNISRLSELVYEYLNM